MSPNLKIHARNTQEKIKISRNSYRSELNKSEKSLHFIENNTNKNLVQNKRYTLEAKYKNRKEKFIFKLFSIPSKFFEKPLL